jgi:hypothetical protein
MADLDDFMATMDMAEFGDIDLGALAVQRPSSAQIQNAMRVIQQAQQGRVNVDSPQFLLAGGRNARSAGAGPDIKAEGDRMDVLGLGRTAIAAGAQGQVIVQPQSAFRPRRLFISADVEILDMDIDNIFVGQQNQLVSADAVNASMFANVSEGSIIRFDTCQVGQLIVITMTNNNAGEQIITGSFTGKTLIR